MIERVFAAIGFATTLCFIVVVLGILLASVREWAERHATEERQAPLPDWSANRERMHIAHDTQQRRQRHEKPY